MSSLIVQIILVFLAIGAAYGIGAGTITSMVDGINAVTKTFASLSPLIFLLFVIASSWPISPTATSRRSSP